MRRARSWGSLAREDGAQACNGTDHQGCKRRRKTAERAFLAASAISFLWFLIRVIPKPSRASYPCQRAAAPFASAFVVWLLAILGAKWALAKRHTAMLHGKTLAACGMGVLFAACVLLAVHSVPETASLASAPEHSALGTAKGVCPGRVVWVHAPDATDWAGWSSSEHWWETDHTDLAVVEEMIQDGLLRVTSAETVAAAWQTLFTNFNATSGRGLRGYQQGEKVAIKINMTTCNGGSDCDLTTYEKTKNLNRIDNSPQMLLALLRQLVYVAGVPQEAISVGDPTALFPNHVWRPLHDEFPDVHYFDVVGGGGRDLATFSGVPFYWSTNGAAGKVQDYIPVQFADANYLINFAILKGHSAGVTGCGKNLYGALKRCPTGYLYGEGTLDYYDMHLSLPNNQTGARWSPGMGKYRAIVDLMGHRNLGGKTLLCLIDGLFGGYYWDSHPYPWKTAPFGDGTNADWPSSLLVSQDPVAIDSVAYDLLLNEWPAVVKNGTGTTNSLQGGAEDYLHEAALAENPISETFYDPEKDGSRMRSLGVHEHWNNPVDRQYGRNLGRTNGIELIYSRLAKTAPRLNMRRTDQGIVVSWPSSHTGYRLQSAIALSPSQSWGEVPEPPVLFQAQNVVSNPVSGEGRFYRLIK